MATAATIHAATTSADAADGSTERVDAVACLDERVRRSALPARPTRPGRYVEIHGHSETLLVPLVGNVMHIGRGLSADLRLDDASVSRRHAIFINRHSSTLLLDDRSSNGTFVNGRRVDRAELRNGDTFALGRVQLRYLDL
jgi:FHA domain